MKAESAALLSEIESAIRLKVSTDLLRYFTSHSVKSGETRKLQCIVTDGVRWYDPAELESYDKYLRAPWPKSQSAQRPHLPNRIKQEIMLEANCACPVCNHEATGEAAHIQPISKALSHHPENLIWLCPNHHSMVDKVAVVSNVKMETVKVLKELLVERKLRILNLERVASNGLLQLIRQVQKVSALIADTTFSEAKAGLEALAELDVDALGKAADQVVSALAKGKGTQPAPLTSLASAVAKSVKSVDREKPDTLATFVSVAASARTRYLEETDQVDCPLCLGKGQHDGHDCPVCGGEGNLEKRFAHRVVLRDYEKVNCPVCHGSGLRSGQFCEACHGDRTMERHFAERIDTRDFELVPCPLCRERGESRDCPVCHGDHRLEGRFADKVDLADFGEVDCRLCEGSGRVDHDECPVCHGERTMERNIYDGIDWREWDIVKCPRCNGEGNVQDDECRSCGGHGTMYRNQT